MMGNNIVRPDGKHGKRMKKLQKCIQKKNMSLFKILWNNISLYMDIRKIYLWNEVHPIELAIIVNSYEIFEYLANQIDIDDMENLKEHSDNIILTDNIMNASGTVLIRVKLLLKYVKNLEKIDVSGFSPLYQAVRQYYNFKHQGDLSLKDLYTEVISTLLDHGADPSQQLRLASGDDFELLDICLARSKFDISKTALYYSIQEGNYDFVEHLLKFVDNLDEYTNEEGHTKTFLQYALDNMPRNDDIIELLRVSDPHPGHA